jgi:hypothetical protein
LSLLLLQALLRELLIASEDRMALMAGPEFVYIIAALAKLRAAPDQAWLNRWAGWVVLCDCSRCAAAGVRVFAGWSMILCEHQTRPGSTGGLRLISILTFCSGWCSGVCCIVHDPVPAADQALLNTWVGVCFGSA